MVAFVYLDYNAARFIYDKSSDPIGNTIYGSCNFHEGYKRGFKDDMESIFYLVLVLFRVTLKWATGDDSNERHIYYKGNIDYIRVRNIFKIRSIYLSKQI